MVECHEPVAEVIVFLPDAYLIAASMIIHPRQSSVGVRLPRINHVPHVLRRADLSQVPDVVVKPIPVDMVNLHRRKPPVVPSPDYFVHLELTIFARGTKVHIQITVFTISLCALSASHHLARLPVHELSAAVVVVVVSLDASRQCGQLAIR